METVFTEQTGENVGGVDALPKHTKDVVSELLSLEGFLLALPFCPPPLPTFSPLWLGYGVVDVVYYPASFETFCEKVKAPPRIAKVLSGIVSEAYHALPCVSIDTMIRWNVGTPH